MQAMASRLLLLLLGVQCTLGETSFHYFAVSMRFFFFFVKSTINTKQTKTVIWKGSIVRKELETFYSTWLSRESVKEKPRSETNSLFICFGFLM